MGVGWLEGGGAVVGVGAVMVPCFALHRAVLYIPHAPPVPLTRLTKVSKRKAVSVGPPQASGWNCTEKKGLLVCTTLGGACACMRVCVCELICVVCLVQIIYVLCIHDTPRWVFVLCVILVHTYYILYTYIYIPIYVCIYDHPPYPSLEKSLALRKKVFHSGGSEALSTAKLFFGGGGGY